jgi:hypothetical protein
VRIWRAAAEDARMAVRFLARLPGFLRHPLGLGEARALLRARFEQRDADFIAMLDRFVFANPQSPYRRLLALAGCERGDLVRLVRQEGVEATLDALFRQGVFLTVEEFKGRRPIVRGSTTIEIDPVQLSNPGATVHFVAHSSGSREPRTAVPFDLGSVRDHAVNRRLSLEARGALRWHHAVWGVPGGGELVIILRFAACGAPPRHWFSPIDPAAPEVHSRYRWSAAMVKWGSILAGVPLPEPRHASMDDPQAILAWMTATRRTGATPHLKAFTSLAMRLCEAASREGVELDGVRLTVTGEPLTAARAAVIARAGAAVAPDYGTTESGQLGEPCVAPVRLDDVHACDDLHALIQPGDAGTPWGLPPRALLITSLRPTSPLILLNASMGDEARMSQRACGCPMEREGWRTHLDTIRSFEKLTAAGMTFLDADVVRVLEEVLPDRFGGSPSDWQLVETEGPEGQPRLHLLADPAVGPLDPDVVVETFLIEIGRDSPTASIMGAVWRGARLLTLQRARPLKTASGKILHVHREGRSGRPAQGSGLALT